MRTFRVITVSFVVLVVPLVASAQSTNASVSALLAQITALQQQIATLTGSTSAATSAASTGGSYVPAACPLLTRSLSLGASGADVASLQSFLIAQGDLQASATGYFGTLTQAAVSQWQQQHGVVAGGDPTAVGLGVVGPKTRAAIQTSCAGAGQSSVQNPSKTQCLPASPPQTNCSTGWKRVLDSAGCTMYYQCSISLPTPSAATSSSSGTSCPLVNKPVCSGAVTPFQTNANGCIVSYQCTI
ncbi:MAG TPA: peptidoglycan-binding domain-containing protein [Candidatus Paceibacterota bacterium]|nr:peptidoglycan-binding domain-containing protein [Candidatus Paceibacterota bacterium]